MQSDMHFSFFPERLSTRHSCPVRTVSTNDLTYWPISIASEQAVVSAAKVDLQTRGFADDFQSRTLIALFPVAKPAASVSVTSHLRILFLCFAGFLIEGCVVHDPTVVIFFVQHEPRFSIKHCIGPRRVMENDVLKAVKVEGT